MSAGKIARIVIFGVWLIVALIMLLVGSDMLVMCFVGCTYSLCWVGFPIGWNYVRDRYPESIIMALMLGLLVMCFSIPIAFFQIFIKED